MNRTEALQEVLNDVAERLTAKLVEGETVQVEIAELRIQQQGLETLIAHYRGTPKPESNGWPAMPRTQAIEKMLKMLQKPASPKELTRHLAKVGRDDDRDAVAAALAYLHQKRRVKSLGRGQWVPDEPANDVAEVVTED